MVDKKEKAILFDLPSISLIKPESKNSLKNNFPLLPQIKKIREIQNGEENSSDEVSSDEDSLLKLKLKTNINPSIQELCNSKELNINKEDYVALEKLHGNYQKSANVKKVESILEALNLRKKEILRILNDSNENCKEQNSSLNNSGNLNLNSNSNSNLKNQSKKNIINMNAKQERNLYHNRFPTKKKMDNKKSLIQEDNPLLSGKEFNAKFISNISNVSDFINGEYYTKKTKNQKFEVISKYIKNLPINKLIEFTKMLFPVITPYPKLNLCKSKFDYDSNKNQIKDEHIKSVKCIENSNKSIMFQYSTKNPKQNNNEFQKINKINQINKTKNEIHNILSQNRKRKSNNDQIILNNYPRRFRLENVENIHHKTHQINFIINLINTFLNLTLKNKKPDYKIEKILKLAKLLSINISKSDIHSTFFQSKEESYLIKEHLLKLLYLTINKENNLNQNMLLKHSIFNKIYVADGNNSFLVKSIIKQRIWWTFSDSKEWEQSNFIWTPWKNQIIIDNLPSTNNLSIGYQKFINQPSSQIENTRNNYLNSLEIISQKNIKSLDEIEKDKLKISYNIPRIYNHFEGISNLYDKKSFYMNLKEYYSNNNMDLLKAIPETFLILNQNDNTIHRFISRFNQNINKNIWIIKPGENTNRGNGIIVTNNLNTILEYIKRFEHEHSFIVQKYIENPLLINNRKFDIRCFSLITCINGLMKGYFYNEGYLRTSSKEYSLETLNDTYIHLTNDAIQKISCDYGKFELGNKLSFNDFQKYLDKNFEKEKLTFTFDFLPQIRKLVYDSILATYDKLNLNKKYHCFELLGYDFIITDNFEVRLIEVNSNPCLEQTSILLSKIIPLLIDTTLRITIDPIFPPIEMSTSKKLYINDILPEIKYELIFDEKIDCTKD